MRAMARYRSRHALNTTLAAIVVFIVIGGMLTISGCTRAKTNNPSKNGSSESTKTQSGHMSGPPVDVYVSQELVDARRPQPWDLGTPESAVSSYLAWVSYAYRIGDSQVSTPTMGPFEEVRVDSYCQYNIEKKRLLDQTLDSIEFGTQSKTATATLVPTRESWTYSYLSVDRGNAVLEGPYKIDYTSVYTVAKNEAGDWVVQSVNAKAQGKVK